jgi:hypothetical protein
MDLYERIGHHQKNVAYSKALRKQDKFERGKDINDWAESVATGVPSNAYRDNWMRIFGNQSGNAVFEESAEISSHASEHILDEDPATEPSRGSGFDFVGERLPGVPRAKTLKERETEEIADLQA